MGESPVVVVGTPGSGTRVFARLTAATGRSMGAHLGEADDALAFFRFTQKWCPIFYPSWRYGLGFDRQAFEADLQPCLEAHLSETAPGAPWGWKQPRSMHLLPAFAAVFPDLRVIHVLRDGRDVAFSARPNVRLSSSYVLPPAADDLPDAVKAAIVWDEPNRLAADFGERQLGGRYLRLRLEDACADPEATAAELGAFVGGTPIGAERLRAIVDKPASLGRWREKEPQLVAEIAQAASKSLQRFGYVPQGDRPVLGQRANP